MLLDLHHIRSLGHPRTSTTGKVSFARSLDLEDVDIDATPLYCKSTSSCTAVLLQRIPKIYTHTQHGQCEYVDSLDPAHIPQPKHLGRSFSEQSLLGSLLRPISVSDGPAARVCYATAVAASVGSGVDNFFSQTFVVHHSLTAAFHPELGYLCTGQFSQNLWSRGLSSLPQRVTTMGRDTEMSEYERRREEVIKKNLAVLGQLKVRMDCVIHRSFTFWMLSSLPCHFHILFLFSLSCGFHHSECDLASLHHFDDYAAPFHSLV